MVQVDEVPTDGPRAADAAWQPTIGPFECFGQRWSLRTPHAELAAFLAEMYAPMLAHNRRDRNGVVFSVLPPDGDRLGVVLRDGRVLVERPTPSATLGTLIWAINRHVIDDSARPLILHAAAAAKDGSVVVLPAPMESGKTTLVTGLLDRGWDYLTDEAAAIHPDGTVEGYPKPLSIDPGSWEVLRHHEPRVEPSIADYLERQWQVAPSSFTGVVRSGPVRVIAFPSYRHGQNTAVREVPPAEALLRMANCSFQTRTASFDARMVRQLAKLVESTIVLEITGGHLEGSCEALEAAFAG